MSTPKGKAKRNLVMSPKVTKNPNLVVRPLGPHLRSNSNTTKGTDSTSHSSGDDHQLVDPKTISSSLRPKSIPFHEPDEHDLDGFSQYGAFGDFSEVDFSADPSREAFQATSLSDAWGQPLSTDDFVIQDDCESEYEEESIDDEEYEAYMESQRELQMSQGDCEYIEEWVPVDTDDEEFEEITVASEEYDAYLQHLVGDGEQNGCAVEVLAIIGRELKVEKTTTVDASNNPPETKGVEQKKKKKVKKKEHKVKKEKGSEKVKSKKSSSTTTSSSSTSKHQSSASPVKTPKTSKNKLSSSEEPKTTEKTKKTTKLSIPKSSSKSADCSLSVKTPDSDSPSRRRKKIPSVALSPSTPEEEVKQALESSTNSLKQKVSKKTKESKTKKVKTHKSTSTASQDGTTSKEISPSRSTKESPNDFSLPLKSSSSRSKVKKPKSFAHIMDDCDHSVFSAPLESKSKKRSSSRKSTDSVGGSSSRSILSAPTLRSCSKTLKSRKDRLERKNASLGIVDNSASLASLSSKLKKSAKSGSSGSDTKKVKSSKTENEASLKSPTKLTKVNGGKSSKVSTKDAGGADTSKSSKVNAKVAGAKVAGTKDTSRPLKVSTADAGAKDTSKVHTSSKTKTSSSKSMTMEVKPIVGQESPRRGLRLIRYEPTTGKE